MTYNSLEDSLISVLAATHLPALPAQRQPNARHPWLRAIVIVDKGISSNYAIATSDGAHATIVKDFGRSAVIKGITAVFPYVVLNEKYVPKLKTDADIVRYIAGSGMAPEQQVLDLLDPQGKSPEQITADRQQVADLVNMAAVRIATPLIDIEQERKKAIQNISRREKANISNPKNNQEND